MTLDQWLKVAQIFAAVFFGGAAIVVSLQQLKIAKIKQRLELYDKRKSILEITRDYISKILNSPFDTKDVIEFKNATIEAKFLFNSDIVEKIEWLADVGFEIEMQNLYLAELKTGFRPPGAPENPAREKAILAKHVARDMDDIFELFRKYMKLYG